MKMRVVSANVAPAKEKVSALCYRALGITAENVLADCKSYVPYDSGALAKSRNLLFCRCNICRNNTHLHLASTSTWCVLKRTE